MTTDQRRREIVSEKDARIAALEEQLRTLAEQIAQTLESACSSITEEYGCCEDCAEAARIARGCVPLDGEPLTLADAWDQGYETGMDDELFHQRGSSSDSDAHEYPHTNPYRAAGPSAGERMAAKMQEHKRLVDHAATVEAACEVMHDAYEAAAVEAGWKTQARSRKTWADVPEPNKVTMRRAVSALLAHLSTLTPAPDGQFYLGDKVRVVLEGVLESYDAELGHYTIRGNSTGAQHVEWIHNLHWGTEFEVIEPGPRGGDRCSSCGGAKDSPPCQRNPLTNEGGHTLNAHGPAAGDGA